MSWGHHPEVGRREANRPQSAPTGPQLGSEQHLHLLYTLGSCKDLHDKGLRD